MDDWRRFETVPDEGHVLVWLPEPHLGSHIHTMRLGKAATIGSLFAWDVGKPTHWRPLPDGPADALQEG